MNPAFVYRKLQMKHKPGPHITDVYLSFSDTELTDTQRMVFYNATGK